MYMGIGWWVYMGQWVYMAGGCLWLVGVKIWAGGFDFGKGLVWWCYLVGSMG